MKQSATALERESHGQKPHLSLTTCVPTNTQQRDKQRKWLLHFSLACNIQFLCLPQNCPKHRGLSVHLQDSAILLIYLGGGFITYDLIWYNFKCRIMMRWYIFVLEELYLMSQIIGLLDSASMAKNPMVNSVWNDGETSLHSPACIVHLIHSHMNIFIWEIFNNLSKEFLHEVICALQHWIDNLCSSMVGIIWDIWASTDTFTPARCDELWRKLDEVRGIVHCTK